jgi:Concanavalin A-like lectin/glucanases superfamily
MSIYSDVILARSPLAYWPLESLSVFTDLSGHGYIATPTVALSNGSIPFATSGPSTYLYGSGGRFFISSTDISWPMSLFPVAGSAFSVEYWIRNTDEFGSEVNFWSKTGTNEVGCYGPISGAGVLVGLSGIEPEWRLCATVESGLVRTQWHYVVETFDGTTWCQYVDCVQLSASTVSWHFGSTVAHDGVWFGSQFGADMEVAHLAVYTRVLTFAEVLASCAARVPVNTKVRLKINSLASTALRHKIHTGDRQRLVIATL